MMRERDDMPMPHNSGIEMEVAGILMLMTDEPARLSKAALLLRGEDFFHPGVRQIVKTILGLLAAGRAADMVNVRDELKNSTDFILECCNSTCSTALLEDRIRTLKAYTAQRQAIARAEQLFNSVRTSDDPISEIREAGADFAKYANRAEFAEERVVEAGSIKSEMTLDGISSGFATHDYNDSGLKGGGLTLVTGFRGDGKTTIVRQMVIAAAMQGVGAFNFIGETSSAKEKKNFAKLCAFPGELHVGENLGGRKVYYCGEAAEKRFDEKFGKFIKLCDTNISQDSDKLFDVVFGQMREEAEKGTSRLFALDNMTVLNRRKGDAKFGEQERITEMLKGFAVRYDAHVILVAHQAKGQTRVSGVSMQEDLADTVLRYVRHRDPADKILATWFRLSGIPKSHMGSVSATLLNEKVRDEGSQITMFLGWDGLRGACIEISPMMKAMEYEVRGLWSRHVSRMDDGDFPEGGKYRAPYKD